MAGSLGQHAGTAAALLVGRATEQRLLGEALAEALAGRGGLIVLGGEAGIGKTTLARDLVRQAAREHVLTIVGHAYDLTNTPPYGIWVEVAANARGVEAPSRLPRALATGQVDLIANQADLFSETRAFFAELANAGPVLLLLEDCHWADHASLELLRHLAPSAARQRLLLMVTYRSDELTRQQPFYQHLPSLLRESGGRRLELHRLDDESVRTYVRDRLPMPPVAEDRLVAYLGRHAEGNPFFVVELLRALTEAGALARKDDVWDFGESGRLVMPSLIRQIIDVRVDRLGESTRQLLELAAVVGQEVPLNRWARLAGLNVGDLLPAIEQAAAARILDAEGDGAHVRFVHALTRQAIYDGVIAPRRRQWHFNMAEVLFDEPDASPDVIAFHLQQAGDPRAWEWLERAGDRAQRAYAWLTAIERFAAAAALLDGQPGRESRRAQLLFRCGRLCRLSNPEEGIAYLTAAESAARTAGNRLLELDAVYSRGLVNCYADDFAAGLARMESAVVEMEAMPEQEARPSWRRSAALADALPAREADDAPDADEAARSLIEAGVHHRRGGLAWYFAAAGRLARSEATGQMFVALADGKPGTILVTAATGHAWFGLGLARAALGRPDEARYAFARARSIYHRIDHHAVIGFSLLSELRDVDLTYFPTDISERRLKASEAEAALERASGAFLSTRCARRARLGLLYLEGKWDEAEAIASEVEADGNYVLRREATNTLVPIWRHRGQFDRVREHARSLLPQGPAAEPGGIVLLDGLMLQRLLAGIALHEGDVPGAGSWLEANDRWLAWSGAVLGRAENRAAWAEFWSSAGDADRAAEFADEAIALASDPRQPRALLEAHRLRAELAVGRGDWDAAEGDLEAALRLADACAAPFERALTWLAFGELKAASGFVDETRRMIEKAREILAPLGAKPALARLDALATRLGGLRSGSGLRVDLTPRELEVLRLVAEGLTDAEAADRLYISPRTVSQHLRSVYGKLDVSSRTAATRFAVERGLV